MKRILIFFIILCFWIACCNLCFATWWFDIQEAAVTARKNAGGAVCTASAIQTCTEAKSTDVTIDSSAGSYQQIDNAVTKTICQVDFYLSISGSSTAHLEIRDTSGTQIGGDSDTETLADGTLQNISFSWSANKPIVTGDYRVVIVEDSGGISVNLENDGNGYSTTDFDFVRITADQNKDARFIVYYDGGD
jgi:hypothetical protein